MGYLKEKYDEAYFLRKDIEGNPLPYGVEGIEFFLKGELRAHDQEILSRIRFSGANVLEFGFGRGETIKYIWEQGANSYTGIDFSEAACNIAKEFLEKFSLVGPKIVCSDATEFVRKFSLETDAAQHPAIDVVVMLDFVEHIPRAELKEVLTLLRPILSTNAVIVINTPEFLFDNDVIAEGLNEKGMDSSDLIEETRGLHCNRYTLSSLRCFFERLGYLPISRGHYFTLPNGNESVWHGESSYRQCWEAARARGVPLRGDWVSEKFEIAYDVKEEAQLYHFHEGDLNGISLYSTLSYLEYYDKGDYDEFLIKFISKYNLTGKTFFDLGAFVGVNSMQFARIVGPEGTVCAFEPNPFNADRLKLNISENPELGDRIKIFPFAISNERGNAKFNVHRNIDEGLSSASYLQGAHTTLSELQLSQLGFTDVNVTMVTLDEFVQNTNYTPACLKIDIEGAEHLALAGAVNTLIQHRPVLLIELHSIFCAIATTKFLVPLGYKIELLYIEPDGRCFIGATVVDLQKRSVDELFQSRQNHVLTELIMLEFEAAKAKLSAITLVNRSLTAELDRKRSLSESLSLQLQQQVTLNESLSLQLEQQVTLNGNLKATLNRYQMFPLIRVLRRLRRIFN